MKLLGRIAGICACVVAGIILYPLMLALSIVTALASLVCGAMLLMAGGCAIFWHMQHQLAVWHTMMTALEWAGGSAAIVFVIVGLPALFSDPAPNHARGLRRS